MTNPALEQWKTRLRALPATDPGRQDRRLFQELNPEMAHAPILKRAVKNPKKAAVLVPVIERDGEPRVIFTVRTASMPSHGGEISFPGGGPKPVDRDLVATALREAEEEIGLARDNVEVIGSLGAHFGGLGFVVTPVVGLVRSPQALVPDPREVDEIFDVPLADIVRLSRHVVETRILNDVSYRMFAFPWSDGTHERHIWGLTAGMLESFAKAYVSTSGGTDHD